MGCGTSCGTGQPKGCKSNGSCNTGSCNRMNVYDWLMNLPFSDPESNCKVMEISFNQGSRKEFYRNATLQYFEKGDLVTVEGVGGFDVGEVSLTGELVRIQLKKKGVDEFNPEIKKVLRPSTERDLELFRSNKAREKEAMVRSRVIARQLNLQMKIAEVEIQADGKKATFYYTAEDRVDFREMIKIFASEFKVKVEMRQIGIRQEAAKVGGIGSCGRELCCSTWLTDFSSVTTTAARYQNLSINQTKLSGQCGRLKCCLNYELDTYLDALQHFPENADSLSTTRGIATLIKKDIFRDLMWYTLPDSSKQYPLTIKRVMEIKQLNKKGEKVEELQPVELASSKVEVSESDFVDVVGHFSVKSLDKLARQKKQQKPGQKTMQKPAQSGKPSSPARPAPQRDKKPSSQQREALPPPAKPEGKKQPSRRPDAPQPHRPKQIQKRPPNKPDAGKGNEG